MEMGIKYRCKHTKHNFGSKQERLNSRREQFDVPEDAVWNPVLDARMVNGLLEVYEVGTFYTVLLCEVCNTKIKIVTDQVK